MSRLHLTNKIMPLLLCQDNLFVIPLESPNLLEPHTGGVCVGHREARGTRPGGGKLTRAKTLSAKEPQTGPGLVVPSPHPGRKEKGLRVALTPKYSPWPPLRLPKIDPHSLCSLGQRQPFL